MSAPAASRLLAWEQRQADGLLADVFGYHAVQLGCPALQALRNNRMPHRWQAQSGDEWPDAAGALGLPHCDHAPDVCMDSRAWPWPAESLDLVVLPHALERSADPHACLREVERVLIPEGQLLITGLNPVSLWGWQQSRWLQRRSSGSQKPSLLAYRRLRDWLRLLGFEVQVSRFGAWAPALDSERWMQRLQWMDTVGKRWWPILGGAYMIMATKRVPGGRLIASRRWRTVRSHGVMAAPVACTDTSLGQSSAPKGFLDSR